MAVAVTLTGPQITLTINNIQYKEVQSVSFSISPDISVIHGIDSLYGQEATPTKVAVSGKINGIRLRLSGGLQAKNIKPLWTDLAQAPYISILIQDRISQEPIFSCFNAMASNETHDIDAKGVYHLSFDFVGLIPMMALDRS